MPPHYIKLEVTESIELVDFKKAKEILNQLRLMGIECSIDDFGIGFSSLSYLPQLPFSEIKIDRSFVSSMNEPGMYAIVQTIIQLAKNIEMRPIAEGIETEEQLAMLQQLGCPAGQGYYFYKPMSISKQNNYWTHKKQLTRSNSPSVSCFFSLNCSVNLSIRMRLNHVDFVRSPHGLPDMFEM